MSTPTLQISFPGVTAKEAGELVQDLEDTINREKAKLGASGSEAVNLDVKVEKPDPTTSDLGTILSIALAAPVMHHALGHVLGTAAIALVGVVSVWLSKQGGAVMPKLTLFNASPEVETAFVSEVKKKGLG